MTEDLHPWRQGFQAAKQQCSPGVCPFMELTPEFVSWHKGYVAFSNQSYTAPSPLTVVEQGHYDLLLAMYPKAKPVNLRAAARRMARGKEAIVDVRTDSRSVVKEQERVWFGEGRAAAKAGKPRTDCPYTENLTDDWQQKPVVRWNQGYSEGVKCQVN